MPTYDGRAVRSGRLFRSAHFSAASENDIQMLDRVGIEFQLDLRQPHERQAKPNRWPTGGIEVLCSDVDGFNEGELLREAAVFELIRHGDFTANAARSRMLEVYAGLVFDPTMVELYRAWFRRLALAEGAVLVHCAAGKDRTGILCALTLHLLGVDDARIFADYIKTNDGDFAAQRVQEIDMKLFEATGSRAPAGVLEAFLRADPDYLHRALSAMTVRYGSILAYLEVVLGVDADLAERVRERLLAKTARSTRAK